MTNLGEQRLFTQNLPEQLVETAAPQMRRNRPLGIPIENQCVKGGGLLYGVPTRIVGTENWFPIDCSEKFAGTDHRPQLRNQDV